jgi:hypothetical protein
MEVIREFCDIRDRLVKENLVTALYRAFGLHADRQAQLFLPKPVALRSELVVWVVTISSLIAPVAS